MTINDTSITKFERNKLVNRIFGNSIKNTFKTSELKLTDDKNLIGCSISHNGYEKNFGCLHKREIYIDKENNKLKGVDHITKKSDGIPVRYVFRFHLNPILTAVKTMSGNSALIQISKNKSLIFTIENEDIEIEKSIIGNKEVEKALKKLKEQNLVFEGKIEAPQGEKKKISETRNQLLFRSTEFGDDKDRALKKGDDSWTYFAGDLAYHNNKISRNFDILINILGADHAGYIKRISSVVDALSKSKQKIECKVTQLVKLIKDNKPFKMSKRKGDYITLEDLINEVGKDAARFIMLSRVSDVELEFDFEKVKLKSKDNPLYYVQYSYARICSIFSNSKTPINNDYKNLDKNFEFNDEEIKIIRKLSEWPKCIETSINKLEPHRLTTYLYQLASIFHSYWNMGRDSEDFRFLDKDKKIDTNKAVLLNCILLVIKNGMEIIGVDTPENM